MLADLEAREGEGQVLRLKWKRRAGGQEGKEGVTRMKYSMVLVLAQLGRSHICSPEDRGVMGA